MSGIVHIRFHDEINDLLPKRLRDTQITHSLKQGGSVKDLIESLGVPHTELDLIVVNGESVAFDYRMKGGEHLEVYPPGTQEQVSPVIHLQPASLDEPRFVLDTHLGRLAAYLRMLGFDSLYRNDYEDPQLADIAQHDERILLSRDKKLLMRKVVVRGYFVRNTRPRQQLVELVQRFDLGLKQHPFSRCMHCNGLIKPVSRGLVESRLLPRTARYYDAFRQCEQCHKIYWKGTHYQRMQALMGSILSW